MKTKILSPVFTVALLLAGVLPSSASAADEAVKKGVVKTYTSIASHAFSDAHTKAVALQKAIATFTAAPSKATLGKARAAWIAARIPYLQTKVFRHEGKDSDLIDSWPIDGKYIDYDLLNPNAGIIGNKDQTLSKESIVGLNKKGGDKNVSCGFHAIEFLLWGIDLHEGRPGGRNFEDYVEGKRPAASRRAQYLNLCADLLVGHLASASSQHSKLSGLSTDKALGEILSNIAATSSDLSEEVAKVYKSRKQEDESSNFSDTTHYDFMYAAAGIGNVIAGAYIGADKTAKVEGKGVLALEKEGGEEVKLGINRVMLAVTSFKPPLDMALSAPNDSPAREAIKEIEEAFIEMEGTTKALAKELGLELTK